MEINLFGYTFKFLDKGKYFSFKARKQRKNSGFPAGAVTSRSSRPDDNNGFDSLLSQGTIKPTQPLELSNIINALCLFNPNFSQAVNNLITTANTGHDIVITGKSDAEVEACHEIIDAMSRRVRPYGNGIEGFVNDSLKQSAIRGATSCEAILTESLDEIRDIEQVPVVQIRFKRDEEGIIAPYQKPKSVIGVDLPTEGLIKLSPITYRFSALSTAEGNPYPIPPYLSALEWAKIEKPVKDNIEFIVKKLGLLGLVDVAVGPPDNMPGDLDDKAQQKWLQSYMKEVAKVMGQSYYDGLLVHDDNMEVTINHLAGEGGKGTTGAIDLLQHIEQKNFSGLNSDPAMHGRSYSTTETYAGVVYDKMVAHSKFHRNMTAQDLQWFYRLELILKKFHNTDIEVQFNENKPFDAEKAAKAEATRLETNLKRVTSGMVDPDEVAQEEGYPCWFDDSKIPGAISSNSKTEKVEQSLKVRFKRNPDSHKYEYKPEVINLGSKKKVELSPNNELGDIKDWVGSYLEAISSAKSEWLVRARARVNQFLFEHSYDDFEDAKDFASQLLQELEGEFGKVFVAESLKSEISASVSRLYNMFRLRDPYMDSRLLADAHLTARDTITQQFVKELDSWYLSKFIHNENYWEPMTDFLRRHYLEMGKGLFGRTSGADLELFRTLFAEQVGKLSDIAIQRIIDTSVMRMRNWAHLRTFHQAGVKVCRLHNPMDGKTSAICLSLHGRIIDVEKAHAKMEEQLAMAPAEYGQFLKDNALTAKYLHDLIEEHKDNPEKVMEVLVDRGVGWPPFHIGCRTRAIWEQL